MRLVAGPCEDFSDLYIKIRDGKISRSEAVSSVNSLLAPLKKFYYDNGGMDFSSQDEVFPLKGYSPDAIGGTNGSGYIIKGYDFFDGNEHGGHPAHDIFIRDKNQDCVDDATGAPVDVLSFREGVVVCAENGWETGSNLRGGNYVMIYCPAENCFYYYAHNSKVNVKTGDIVKPGDKISEVGRSGLNAYKKRSPTHLHISKFDADEGDIKPVNLYDELLSAALK